MTIVVAIKREACWVRLYANFSELKSGGDNSYAVPPPWKVGGRVPPHRPPPIDARGHSTESGHCQGVFVFAGSCTSQIETRQTWTWFASDTQPPKFAVRGCYLDTRIRQCYVS